MDKECSNCGDVFSTGEGYPEEQGGKFECCCSEECWIDFLSEE